jgi:hypothetical protein
MPGALTKTEFHQLEQARGPMFEREWLEAMIAHHEGAIQMARTERAEGVSPAAKKLAAQLIRTHEAELERFQRLLKSQTARFGLRAPNLKLPRRPSTRTCLNPAATSGQHARAAASYMVAAERARSVIKQPRQDLLASTPAATLRGGLSRVGIIGGPGQLIMLTDRDRGQVVL